MAEGLLYEPEFLEPDEERDLVARIARLPLQEAKYKTYTARRRTASFGASYDFEHNRLDAAAELPSFLAALREKVAARLELPAQRFMQALVTEYRPGTALGWHRDAPEFELIAGVSLASSCTMRFRRYPPRRGSDPGAAFFGDFPDPLDGQISLQ